MRSPITNAVPVLVIDHAETTRIRLKALLDEIGGVRAEACSPQQAEALRWCLAVRPRCLVLAMPARRQAEFELLALLRKLCADSRIVVLAEDPSEELGRHCKHLGADHLLDKTNEFERLIEFVADIVNRP